MSPINDSEAILATFEADARRDAHGLTVSRIDSGMDPREARDSVRRWGQRLSAHVLHGVDAGIRAADHEIGGDR